MPAIRLPKVFCRPKPIARPKAPENTASAVRSIPSRSIPMKKAIPQTTMVRILRPSSCCASSKPVKRRSSDCSALVVTQARTSTKATIASTTSTSQTERRKSPTLIASASSVLRKSPAISLRAETRSRMSSDAATLSAAGAGSARLHACSTGASSTGAAASTGSDVSAGVGVVGTVMGCPWRLAPVRDRR